MREPKGFSLDSTAKIEFTSEPGTVVGVISDPATKVLLFSGRPGRALCIEKVPGAEQVKVDTAITYTNR